MSPEGCSLFTRALLKLIAQADVGEGSRLPGWSTLPFSALSCRPMLSRPGGLGQQIGLLCLQRSGSRVHSLGNGPVVSACRCRYGRRRGRCFAGKENNCKKVGRVPARIQSGFRAWKLSVRIARGDGSHRLASEPRAASALLRSCKSGIHYKHKGRM
jgi:hypothetical protein